MEELGGGPPQRVKQHIQSAFKCKYYILRYGTQKQSTHGKPEAYRWGLSQQMSDGVSDLHF